MANNQAKVMFQGKEHIICVNDKSKKIIEYLLENNPGEWIEQPKVADALDMDVDNFANITRVLAYSLNRAIKIFERKERRCPIRIRMICSKEHIEWLK